MKTAQLIRNQEGELTLEGKVVSVKSIGSPRFIYALHSKRGYEVIVKGATELSSQVGAEYFELGDRITKFETVPGFSSFNVYYAIQFYKCSSYGTEIITNP